MRRTSILPPLPALDPYVASRISVSESGCWIWVAGLDRNGYGSYRRSGPNHGRAVHVVVYELIVGPVPNGLQLDHLCHSSDASCEGGRQCRHRRCANPVHLEPVTSAENTRRGMGLPGINARKSVCKRGHEFTPENTYSWPGTSHSRPGRACRACRRLRRNGAQR